ncbi:hypothetical protein [Flavobacterium rhizosphaerae]|uniref:Uncharacterized protein n=1 Tax=Flavobacterium rhizosphaerae TaxID=3163298 RepID=A0ABW8YRT6_9FLAO
MKILFSFCTMVFILLLSAGRVNAQNCEMLHSGKFEYDVEGGGVATVIINGNKHTEYHNDGEYVIESTLKWVNECEYIATLVRATVPGFPFSPGTTLNVRVKKTEGNNIYYVCKLDDHGTTAVFSSKLTKVED